MFAWRRFLGFLSIADQSALGLPAGERLTKARVRSFSDHLAKTNIPRSVAIQVDALYKAARVMMPELDLSWFRSMKARLHSAAPLKRASGPVVTSLQILQVGQRLMEDHDPKTEYSLTLAQAIRYRDGLLISLLAFLPLRRKNLAALEIDRHLIKEGNSRFVYIPAAETKTCTPIEFAVPELLLPYLDVYLATVRPRLLNDPECQALWVSPRGGALRDGAIGEIVSRHTTAILGIRLTPHDTRDAAATTWALAAPTQIGISRDLLSHSDLRTTEKHYNRANGVQASRSLAKILQIAKRRGGRHCVG
ncbi:tyrosine-type recombinase/integrase [Bradyrhizobium sp. 6(2017)]|uniref:tyrosine-type recombinase/integrase n=1 Tax=Bradyrhizobium sp. 6(2017) TaxID=1197460 RepID=UPI0013E11830|nr:tyrosine-type recombinase/integrase [Bradyrhizobium sp. 6(2017)]QIG91836.1 tyrosine-type recombinase/integrase [Bradyrhizobium sp. 6(2017)]